MKPPIIDRADLQTLQHWTITGVLTLIFWAFWLYLWLPLLALLAWVLGVQQAYKYMIVLGGYQEVLRLIGIYTLIILFMGGSLVAWATYNIKRYGGIERRIGNLLPTIEEVARYFRQGPLAVESWQQARRLYVVHDEKGDIAHVEILATDSPVPTEKDDTVQK